MSLEKNIDKSIDQIGDSLEKGVSSFYQNGIAPFFSSVGIGLREVMRKKLYRSKEFSRYFMVLLVFSLIIGLAESIYMLKLFPDQFIVSWLYEKQKILPVPIAMLVLIAGILIYFNNKGKIVIQLRNKFNLAFERCGLFSKRKVDSLPEYPSLFRELEDRDGGLFFVFKNVGLPLDNWEKAKASLEASLEERISEIQMFRNNPGYIQIKIGGSVMPDTVEFNDSLVGNADDNSVVVGVSKEGAVTHNFKSIPHLLVGGATGAGKTVSVRSVAYQGITHLHGILYIIDFKDGADYTDFADLGVQIISERLQVAKLLDKCMVEHKARIQVFKEHKVKNISEYNEKVKDKNKQFRRVFVLIDELAELTDVKSCPKGELDLLDIIIGQLSSIARLCRSTGINLILSTQRPDANVIPGQIKNNVPGRLSGYFADDIAYRIVLDHVPNPRIPDPTKSPGYFVYSLGAKDHHVRTPYFQERHINKNIRMDYETGVLVMKDPFSDSGEDDESISNVPSQRLRSFNMEDLYD